MKTLATLALVTPFLLATSASAVTVIDSFNLDSNALTTSGPQSSQSQPITIAGNPATRTAAASSNGAMTQVYIHAGQFDFVSVPAGGVGSLEYANFALDATATPLLRLTIGSNLGPGQAEIGLISSSGFSPIASVVPIPFVASPPTDLHFDLRTFAGYQPGFLSGVASLAIAFRGASGGDYFLKVNEIALITEDEFGATLPEPNLLALMFPVVFAFSTRRKLPASHR